MLDIKRFNWFEWTAQSAGGPVALASVSLDIGEVEGPGADLFTGLFVAAPSGLAHQCDEDDGFVWGRQTIVVDEFRHHETRDKVFAFAKSYLRGAKGGIDACMTHAGQLAQWEFEDIAVRFNDPNKPPTTQARLLGLSSPDCDLEVGPPDPNNFNLRIHVLVGAAGSEDSGTFELTFCTPNQVGLLRDLRQVSLFDGFAFANHFDLATLKQNVSETCSELMGFTSAEAIAKFGRFARTLSTDFKAGS